MILILEKVNKDIDHAEVCTFYDDNERETCLRYTNCVAQTSLFVKMALFYFASLIPKGLRLKKKTVLGKRFTGLVSKS